MIEENNEIPEDQDPIQNEESTQPEMESAPSAPNPVQQYVGRVKAEIQKVIVGMDKPIEETMIALFTGGHVLFEGFPGVAKTLLVKLLAKSIDVDFKRIQFTPDLMPSDVLGTMIFDQKQATFTFHAGPIFSNLVLIDEINRSPAKTQAALFEVMEEGQITMEGTTYDLSYPFFVIGTQNPIDQEGTYRLPEAQLDRFIFKIKVPFPSQEEELAILERFKSDFDQTVTETVDSVMDKELLKACEKFIEGVHIDSQILKYITSVIHATRNHNSIYLGASPRASLAILKSSKGFAALAGRNYVKPDDVQRALIPVLNHRVLPSAIAEMEGYTSEDIILGIIEEIEVPR